MAGAAAAATAAAADHDGCAASLPHLHFSLRRVGLGPKGNPVICHQSYKALPAAPALTCSYFLMRQSSLSGLPCSIAFTREKKKKKSLVD